jgi:hypothetical protein
MKKRECHGTHRPVDRECYHRWTWTHDFRGPNSRWWFHSYCRDCGGLLDSPYPDSEVVGAE